MSEPRPYKLQVGGTLNPNKHLYIHRRQEEDQLFELLNGREYCNVIASRQVGKSSLVTLIMERLQAAGNRVAYCDISGEIGTSKNAEDWYLGFIGMIALEFGLDIEVHAWWHKQAGATPNQRLMRFFEDVLLKSIAAPLVIIMDEIDFSLNLPYTDDFFVAIRTMYNTRNRRPEFERLTFCLVGVATPNELIKKQRTTPYNIGKTLHLSDFEWQTDTLRPFIAYLSSVISKSPPQSLSLRERGWGEGKEKPKNPGDSTPSPPTPLPQGEGRFPGEALLKRIFYWTAGHPFLTAWLCEETQKAQANSPEQIDRLAQDLFDNISKVSNHPHFERVITFLDNRIQDKLDAYETYERLLAGEKMPARATATHIKLKLAGLVKSTPDGHLAVRNRIYERIFNRDWARKSKPQLTLRNLKRFAVAASVVIVLYTGYFLYDLMILEPPKRMAAELETRLNTTSDVKEAEELFQYLAGKKPYPELKHNPLLGKYLTGFEPQAQAAMAGFWKRIEAATQAVFAALKNTSNETDAKRFFEILSGKIPNPDTGQVFQGQKEKAIAAYKDFWERRAVSLETRALQRLADGDVDKALQLGAAAAVKRHGKLHPQLLEIYQERGYERLYRTIQILKKEGKTIFDRIDFSPNGDSIVVTDGDGIYEIKTGRIIREMSINDTAVRFSRDGNYLADGDGDGMVRLWDLRTQNKPLELGGIESWVFDIDFSTNNQYVAAAGNKNLAVIWNLSTGKILHKFHLPNDGQSIRFSPNGKQLAVGYFMGGAILFDTVSGKKIYDVALNGSPLVAGLDFSPDGKKLAMATWTEKDEKGAFIWDVEKNAQLLHLPFDEFLNGIAFSPDGRYVFAGGDKTEAGITARLWDAASGQVRYKVKGHTDGVNDVSYAANGQWVATVSNDKTARLWDVADLQKPAAPAPTEMSPQELWQRFQLMLNYTLDDNDEVIPLWPTGPRELEGWGEVSSESAR